MNNPKFESDLQYMIGSIFRDETLRKAKIKDSKVFIMTNQFTEEEEKNDTFAYLASKAIKNFDSSPQIYVQLSHPQYLIWGEWDRAVSIQSLKMGLLSCNAFNSGISTFISNLVNSLRREGEGDWEKEYGEGTMNEIFLVSLYLNTINP